MQNLERFESIPFTDAAPFQHINVLTKHSYRVSSERLSTKMQETPQNIVDVGVELPVRES